MQFRSRLIAALGLSSVLSASVISHGQQAFPRVTAVWAAGPLETRVSFDRPIDRAVATALVGTTIALDGRARTADALKPKGPPTDSDSSSLGTLRIAAARLADGGRTLIVANDPHSREGVYSLTLPIYPGRPALVTYDLTGVEAVWDNGKDGAAPEWSGWWPDLNPEITKNLTRGSLEHERGLERLNEPGRLTLRTLVTLPEGRVTLRIESQRPMLEATFGGESAQPTAGPKGTASVEFAVDSSGDSAELIVVVRTGAGEVPFGLTAMYRSGDAPASSLARERQTVPWAPAVPPAPGPGPPTPDLSGGDLARGEAVFYGEAARCANCHQVRGKGKTVGPDLTSLAGRERGVLYREIAEPSALIRPDYVPYTVALKDGRVVVGIVRAEGADAIRVIDTEAKATLVRFAEVEELRPSATSIMPVGLAGAIGEAGMRDLLAFLTSAPAP